MSSSSAASKSGMACCSCSMSRATMSCLSASIRPRRRWSIARRLAVAINHAPGFSGTPVAGQCSSAATRASWVKSSASGTSRSIRDRLGTSRGCSLRQTARMVRWWSAAVIVAVYGRDGAASRSDFRIHLAAHFRAWRHEGANLAGALPARHVLLVESHELDGGCDRLFLVSQFEDRVAADPFLFLDDRAIEHAEPAIGDLDLRAPPERH